MTSTPFLLTEDDFYIDFERGRLYIDIKRMGESKYNDIPKQILENQEFCQQYLSPDYSQRKVSYLKEIEDKAENAAYYHKLYAKSQEENKQFKEDARNYKMWYEISKLDKEKLEQNLDVKIEENKRLNESDCVKACQMERSIRESTEAKYAIVLEDYRQLKKENKYLKDELDLYEIDCARPGDKEE